jgi:hypothetical protein
MATAPSSACTGAGACLGAAPEDCDPAIGNECCDGDCSEFGGCFTTASSCADGCGAASLMTGRVCLGCGGPQAAGVCSTGTAHPCTSLLHTACQEVACGGATYYCTNASGSWAWRANDPSCDDNDPCTYDDTCSGGSCVATSYRCESDLCTDRACDGEGGCDEYVNEDADCGIEDCPGNSCTSNVWHEYPDATCTSTCDPLGDCPTCTCTPTDTACTGSGCCAAGCAPGGCYTSPSACPDTCGATNLFTGSSCQGCGGAGANGTCSPGTSHTCNSATLCQEVTCGGTKYTCTNFGTWAWRSIDMRCNDGSACSFGDVCMSGSCVSSTYTCDSDVCADRVCDGLGGCDETIYEDAECGTETCPADSCTGNTWHDYDPTCTETCDAVGGCPTCSCSPSNTTCTSGGGCCVAACSASGGCSTVPGTCGGTDSCGANTLTLANACTGCGAPGASGSCTGTGTYTCDAGNHTACQSVSCSATTYYCTNAGGPWQWATGKACSDGDACTYNDTCGAGGCAGTAKDCASDTCMTRSCNGSSTCTETPRTGAACGTVTCAGDYCNSGTFYDYPASCTSTCNSGGTCDACSCSATPTACTASGCCTATCDNAAGCSTVAGACADACGTTTMTTGRTCGGCLLNGATGACGGGNTVECSSSNHTLCATTVCGGTTYHCTNVNSVWQWRAAAACDDGNLCTYNDTCGGTTCAGTGITCNSTECLTRACNGTSSCTDTPQGTGTTCGSPVTCPTDNCNSSTWYDYPATCTSHCSGGGSCTTCTCSAATTACTASGCCTATCNAVSGCSTNAGTCADVCAVGTTLTTGRACQNCGVNGAAGSCSAGTVATCNSGSACAVLSCGGTAYYCTNAGGTWSWRTSTTCDDANACTSGDVCNADTCAGSASSCGNGTCDCGETEGTCPADCSPCTAGYQLYNDRCYKYVASVANYDNARTACAADSATLADVLSAAENQFIATLMPDGSNFWIGLNDEAVAPTANGGNPSCGTPEPADNSTGNVFSGSTSNASNAISDTCNSYTHPGKEEYFRLMPATGKGGNWRLIARQAQVSGYDLAVFLDQNCSTGNNACADNGTNCDAETITYSLTAMTVYYVYVDGYTGGGGGSYTLDLVPPAALLPSGIVRAFRWEGGSAWNNTSFTNFLSGEPNFNSASGCDTKWAKIRCVIGWRYSGAANGMTWSDDDCTLTKPYVCEKAKP